MADSPPDKIANVVVTSLTQEEAHEMRREIIIALHNPGIEFGENDEESRKIYVGKLKALDAHLETFPEKI
jgi:hypothetical protein